jgi:hypothetical protein
MAAATPGLRAPTSVRVGDFAPELRRRRPRRLACGPARGAQGDDGRDPRRQPRRRRARCDGDDVSEALSAAGVEHGRATPTGLDQAAVTVVPVSVVKGLELDGVVVVEPARIVADEQHGLRALYVALTRSTRGSASCTANRCPTPCA